MRCLIISICLFSLISGCKEFSEKSENKTDDCIVRYKDDCLSKKELQSVTFGLSAQDSSRMADIYIKDWLIRTVMYHKAKNSIDIDKDELNHYIEEYKKQYYVSQYLKKYIEDNLDTSVTNKEILEYYQLHKEAFKLTNNIAQIYYVKLNDMENDITQFKKLLSKKDKNELNKFIFEKGMSYFIEDSLWIKWDDVCKEVPALKNYDINFFTKGKILEWKDGVYYYYIQVKDIKTKNQYSPVMYEKTKIKNIILNERKNKLLNDLKSSILLEVEKKK